MAETRIAGRYLLQEELGIGGMGRVFKGFDTRGHVDVAIKQLHYDLTTPQLIERFRREGETLRALNHPNIVKMIDAVQHDGRHFLVMEYVPGGDLGQKLQHEALSIDMALRYALDLSDALTRAHKLNIIHRDLKPGNVLIGTDGIVRLTDFGVAYVPKDERVTETGSIVGTAAYLAPEVLQGQDADARSDIWSFGVLLFEMLTSRQPFARDTSSLTLVAILTEPAPELENLRPDCPVALVDLVNRMLEKNPNSRIRSARLVGAELEAIIEGAEAGIYPASPPARRFDTPTPPTPSRRKHNLPPENIPFVGRESELSELADMLRAPATRLITILAPGGMGKTRLALELARQFAGEDVTPLRDTPHLFESGVFFIELAPLSDPASIVPAIAAAAGYQFQQDERDPTQQILDFLRSRQMLLVLDNFEHLLPGAELVAQILQTAPGISVLATSRERLNLSEETLFRIIGMDFPSWETPEDALEYSAVKLFMQSAHRARPGFELNARDLDYVARICGLVEGMPLGILLAAGWLDSLTLEEITAEIGKSLDFLETEALDIPTRHRSIRAVFNYSWNLLDEAEREVFMKLAIFRGGFTRQAAQAVSNAHLRQLTSLVNKSLIRRDVDTGRYHIHELLRQYAEEQLVKKGLADAVRDLHKSYFLDWLAGLEADLKGRRQLAALDEIDIDYENLRLAWIRAADQRDYAALDHALESHRHYFDFRGRHREADQFLSYALDQFGSPQNAEQRFIVSRIKVRRAKVLMNGLGVYSGAIYQDVEAHLSIAHERDDLYERGLAYNVLGWVFEDSDPRTLDALEHSVACYRAIGDDFHLADALNLLAIRQLPDYAAAQPNLHESILINRKIGNVNGLIWTLLSQHNIQFLQGQIEESLISLDEMLSLTLTIGSRRAQILVYYFMGWAYFLPGNLDDARRSWQAAYPLAVESHDAMQPDLAFTLALVNAVEWEQYDEALHVVNEQDKAVVAGGGSIATPRAVIACGMGDFSTAKRELVMMLRWIDTTYIDGVLMGMAAAAAVLAHEGQNERAVETLALAMNQIPWYVGWMEKWPLLNRLRADLVRDLGRAVYRAAWERGQSHDLFTVVHELLAEFEES